MTIDLVARAMTAGSPRPGFTARVMAPIYGRPRPDFTARVMSRLDLPAGRPPVGRASVGRGFSPGIAVLASAAVAASLLIAAAAAWLVTPAALVPLIPDTPSLTGYAYDREAIETPPLPVDRWAVSTRTAPRPRPQITVGSPRADAATVRDTVGQTDTPTLYTIAPLEPPAPIAAASIAPSRIELPALTSPAPLRVIALPGSGPSHISKEKD